jgi:hypothetical protein
MDREFTVDSPAHCMGHALARAVRGGLSVEGRGAAMIEPWMNAVSALVAVGLFLGTVRLRRA